MLNELIRAINSGKRTVFAKVVDTAEKNGTLTSLLRGTNTQGESPIICAIKKNYTSMAVILIKIGLGINYAVPDTQKTPLMYAAEYGNEIIVEELINAGASLQLKDSRGNTAYDIAVGSGNNEIAEMIEDPEKTKKSHDLIDNIQKIHLTEPTNSDSDESHTTEEVSVTKEETSEATSADPKPPLSFFEQGFEVWRDFSDPLSNSKTMELFRQGLEHEGHLLTGNEALKYKIGRIAIMAKDVELIERIINLPDIDLNLVPGNGLQTLLYFISDNSDFKEKAIPIIDQMLEKGADPFIKVGQDTSLHKAIANNNYVLVQKFIDWHKTHECNLDHTKEGLLMINTQVKFDDNYKTMILELINSIGYSVDQIWTYHDEVLEFLREIIGNLDSKEDM